MGQEGGPHLLLYHLLAGGLAGEEMMGAAATTPGSPLWTLGGAADRDLSTRVQSGNRMEPAVIFASSTATWVIDKFGLQGDSCRNGTKAIPDQKKF